MKLLSNALAVILAIVGVTVLAAAVVLICRYYQTRIAPSEVPEPPQQLAAAVSQPAHGRFETSLTYTCLASPTGEATSTITWDDAWFALDSNTYNHELARAAAVLSALAYAESNYYQASYDCPPYMEDALTALGFDEVSTESYRYRSEIVDQVLNVFTQEEDSVAYTIARKRLDDGAGAARSVILVSVRGSYGAEWVSNLYVGEQGAAPHEELAARAREALEAEADRVREAPDLEALLEAHGNHAGYTDGAAEIMEAVRPWIAASHERGDAVTLLVVGHSRGGAIANIVAAQADDELAGAKDDPTWEEGALGLGTGDAVMAYTFASPATTVSQDAHDARYGNIFNIVNPSDIVPYLPLSAWGYGRYGEDRFLPAVDDAGFYEAYSEMCVRFEQAVGTESPYDPADARTVQAVIAEVSRQVPTADAFLTPQGVASVIGACATNVDPIRILYGHYPSTYIAWMQAIEEEGLRGQHS